MKSIAFVFTLIFTCVTFGTTTNFCSSGNEPDRSPIVFPKGSTYEDVWKEVTELEGKNLPKSALDMVDAIYSQAKQDTNYAQIIKSIIHKQKYKVQLEEDPYQKIIDELKAEIDSAYFPLEPVLHSLLADVYWSFYQTNRWRFHNRTVTEGFLTDDINTWDTKHIVDASIKHYNLSLQNTDSLRRTELNLYDDILVLQHDSRKFRPTLYDFLAHRCVDFMMNSETGLTSPSDNFRLSEDFYFSPASDFTNHHIESKDSMSLKYYCAIILQDLLKFHAADDSVEALIDVDLKRLLFVYQNSIHNERDSLYLQALKYLEEKNISQPASAEVSYRIALSYRAKGLKYQPLVSDDNKWMIKKAYDYCSEIIKRHPESTGATYCDYLKKQIEEKTVNFNIASYNQSNKSTLFNITYKNLSKIYFRIIKVNRTKHQNDISNKYGDELLEYFSKLEPAKEWSAGLADEGDYQIHSIENELPPLEFGYYVILASPDKNFSPTKNCMAYGYTQITNIAYTQRKDNKDTYDIYAYNRESGEPLKGISVILWKEKYNYTLQRYVLSRYKTLTTDKDGFIRVAPASRNGISFHPEFINGKDKLFVNESLYHYKPYYYKEYEQITTHFFTDREIYRPGQTLYFKGIVMDVFKGDHKIKPNFQSIVYLYDVNHQIISQIQLTTNEYGTISGSFTVPQGVMPGQMYITNNYGYKYFSAEEYKRPKFEVKFNSVKGSYKLNEKITTTGLAKAYAGSNIDGAAVKYEVKRSAYFPYRWYWCRWFSPVSDEAIIKFGTTTTDENGEFKIDFEATPDLSVKRSWRPSFVYTVTADVTDINGETRSSRQDITVGYTALMIATDLKANVNRNTDNVFEINTTNLSGEFTPAKGTVRIYKLKENPSLFRSKLWTQPDIKNEQRKKYYDAYPYEMYDNEDDLSKLEKEKTVLEKEFNTADKKKFNLSNIYEWNQGRYLIEIKSKDIFGEEVEYLQNFVLYDPDNQNVAVNEIAWFTPIKTKCEPGEKAMFLVGSADTNVHVLYEIEHKDKIISKQWIILNKEQKLIELPIEEKHRGNLSVHFVIIKHDRSYTYNELITVPYSNKELDIAFETFRNKLYPGEKEEWRIRIKGKKGEQVAAEMLATLYDASLDAFKPNNWFFNIYETYYSSMNWYNSGAFISGASSFLENEWNNYGYVGYRYYDQLNWFGFYYGGYNYYSYGWDSGVTRGGSAYGLGDISGLASLSEDSRRQKSDQFYACNQTIVCDAVTTGSTTKAMAGKSYKKKGEAKESGYRDGNFLPMAGEDLPLAQVKVRKNFSETAFFFPQLETNEQGEVIIKFTVPEALTKWKMLGFAHTKDLKFGLIDNELVTQKDLMVMPNVPRFLRENDEITLTAKVSNLSKKSLKGKAQLLLFDALTMKPVDGAFENTGATKEFSVKEEQSTALTWKIKVPEGVQAVTYRFTAQTPEFSDGEENTIPVLTNRMLVTESLPLPIRGNQTKEFKFEKLLNSGNSKTLKHHKVTLEFTANPAWYAVQALPYIIEYPYECAEQTFSRYYGNSIASHIANSSPKIKAVFDSWKNTPESKALLSNLEKNQELKSLLLEETPWVLDAQDEGERKRRVGLLFDLNHMSNNLRSAKRKLQRLQAPNGGWVWFKGGPDDRYITQHIITGFGHLDHLGVKDVRNDWQVWQMVTKGVSYLDNEIRKDYKELKKYYSEEELKKDHISYYQIQYLYARSNFTDLPIPAGTKEAFDYFKGQAKKYWTNKSFYMQGMIALGLHRYEDTETPMAIIKSLKEHAQVSEEMGMYWKSSGGYYWYQAPIETHALLTEAFDEILNDPKITDDLRVWLLKQKQTQDWKTTKATTEAVYALLKRGTDWLATESAVEIMVGDININPREIPELKAEAGTGYIKTSWSGDNVKSSMGNIKVTKKDEGVSWGALYWQYFEQLDKITPHETPLKLNKQLFKEVQTSSGKTLEPIKDNSTLDVGDKVIVRIELRVDRRMEYVHMKDMRAACFEPLNVISQYKYQDGLGYYESTKDVATNFFFSNLNKGTYVFEYPLWTTHKGDFSNGITTIQCMYAPEFTSHSEGIRVGIE